MFINAFFELLALLGSIVVFGIIIIAAAFVIFIVANVIRGLVEAFKNGGKKDGKGM